MIVEQEVHCVQGGDGGGREREGRGEGGRWESEGESTDESILSTYRFDVTSVCTIGLASTAWYHYVIQSTVPFVCD